MREIDQALARAYGSPTHPPRTAGASANSPSPPGPHFSVEPRSSPINTLVWPETVLTLERQHGDRFTQFADALLEARDHRHLKLVFFTSCHRAEGRTTLVLNLARALARRPGKTLLVDADFSGPMLARQLGLRPRYGLDDVIESGVSAAEAVIDAPDDHLSILPLKVPVARPREFVASAEWGRLMARLRHDYDLILLDGGPLFVGLNSAWVPGSIDAAVIVHHAGLTGERAMLRAREILDDSGVPLLGLAETFC